MRNQSKTGGEMIPGVETICFTPACLEYLLESSQHRSSFAGRLNRAEAYYQLFKKWKLNRMLGQYNIVTTQSLADAWRWDKATVSRFLGKLEELGCISISKSDEGRVINILNTIRPGFSELDYQTQCDHDSQGI